MIIHTPVKKFTGTFEFEKEKNSKISSLSHQGRMSLVTSSFFTRKVCIITLYKYEQCRIGKLFKKVQLNAKCTNIYQQLYREFVLCTIMQHYFTILILVYTVIALIV